MILRRVGLSHRKGLHSGRKAARLSCFARGSAVIDTNFNFHPVSRKRIVSGFTATPAHSCAPLSPPPRPSGARSPTSSCAQGASRASPGPHGRGRARRPRLHELPQRTHQRQAALDQPARSALNMARSSGSTNVVGIFPNEDAITRLDRRHPGRTERRMGSPERAIHDAGSDHSDQRSDVSIKLDR